MRIVRLYTGDDGESHFEDLDVAFGDHGPGGRISVLVPGSGVMFREVAGSYDLDFHPAPRRQFVVNLSGSVEIEVGDGTHRRLGPGSIMLAEDTHGRGHRSRAVDGQPRECLFVPIEEDAALPVTKVDR